MTCFKESTAGVTVSVRVLPGASKNQIVGLTESGDLKIKVQSPPVEGAANAAVTILLAELFLVRARDVVLLRGEHSRQKVFGIAKPVSELRALLRSCLDS